MEFTKFKKISGIVIALSLALLSACGGVSTPEKTGSADTSTVKTAVESTAEETQDIMAKYTPPIEVSTIYWQNPAVKFIEGESFENNVWTRAYESELGIKIKAQSIIELSKREEKTNIIIASNNLPDIMPVTQTQLSTLASSGKIADLTEIVDKYASPLLKKVMMDDGGYSQDSASFNGKLMALVGKTPIADSASILWVRVDWLKNLGLNAPKTIDDVINIANAFALNDPDKNLKADTIGLAFNKDLLGGFAELSGFFAGFHAYPNRGTDLNSWVKDPSGTLTNGCLQPQVKTALAKLQEMYKARVLDQEFGTRDQAQITNLVVSGKVGMLYGPYFSPALGFQDNHDKDLNADWKAFPIVSSDGTPAQPIVSVSPSAYYVVNNNIKNPEAAVKILNFYIEKYIGEGAPAEYFLADDGRQQHLYAPISTIPNDINTEQYKQVQEALKTKDTSKLSPMYMTQYKFQLAYLNGDNTAYRASRIFGEGGAFSVIDYYIENDLILTSEFTKAPTQTMKEKTSTLRKMEVETFTKIILGYPLSDFDKFIDDWNKLGGADITKEVNDIK